ncbi:hypothetical protein PDIG_79490 [Penicillium digitatum PHI26]|uniref:Uncharacterized protein n=2 Tax=Penicillium digitatum TaxID=36651 RepID=K9FYP9_PEND2|nr:hypothetical protein PDIP_27880 [Penicillium digitatum Pd1]EKV06171.1 hypothetical protein PDIG_79490 [Penicillium digitatum PHI26]EKV18240.1 hypothetical protein PDIP_27880 [Penicillium digitatum Pd1]
MYDVIVAPSGSSLLQQMYRKSLGTRGKWPNQS